MTFEIDPNKKRFTTTITRENLNIKQSDLKKNGVFTEYKSLDEHWADRLHGIDPPTWAIFLCGREVNNYVLVRVDIQPISLIPHYAQRYVTTEWAYALDCMEWDNGFSKRA